MRTRVTMTLSLPSALRDYVEQVVSRELFASSSEYLRALIRADMEDTTRVTLIDRRETDRVLALEHMAERYAHHDLFCTKELRAEFPCGCGYDAAKKLTETN